MLRQSACHLTPRKATLQPRHSVKLKRAEAETGTAFPQSGEEIAITLISNAISYNWGRTNHSQYEHL